jgi:hypothetical protein
MEIQIGSNSLLSCIPGHNKENQPVFGIATSEVPDDAAQKN